MERLPTIIFAVGLGLAFLFGTGWLLWRWMRGSRDAPAVLIVKWIVSTIALLAALAAVPVLGPFGPFLIVFCALVLSVLWTPNLGAKLGGWMSGGMDGGSFEPEPKPAYSLAQGMRKRGRYSECVAELRRQLNAFPDDFEGETLLAEVLAENFQDFFSAQVVLERIANNARRAPQHRAYALTQLADWHLKFHQDVDAARAALQNILEWLPASEHARKAAQRLSHLDVNGGMTSVRSRPIKLHPVEDPPIAPAPAGSGDDMIEELSRLSDHLRRNPADAEARELLARLYADHLGQPELAFQELEQGAVLAGSSMKEVARWLNLKADYQVRSLGDVASAGATLQRLVDQFPGTAFAVAAEQRIARLGLEARGKQKSQGLRLGSYEKDLGLSGSRPVTGD